jgi:CobQ-like glutamine amidotransferase family enzyme
MYCAIEDRSAILTVVDNRSEVAPPTPDPLRRVESFLGRSCNDGRSGLEGAVANNAIGTYLHSHLLPQERLVRRLIAAAFIQ